MYANIFSFDLEFHWQNKTLNWAVVTYLHSYDKVFKDFFVLLRLPVYIALFVSLFLQCYVAMFASLFLIILLALPLLLISYDAIFFHGIKIYNSRNIFPKCWL